jgi:hypothetical protein
MDNVQPIQRSLAASGELRDQYETWMRQRSDFNARLGRRDPEAIREAWQRYYFKGEVPENMGPAPADHVNKRRLKSIKLGF